MSGSSGTNLNAWAKALSDRLTEKTEHVHTIVEQKLEYQHKYLEQRLETISSVQAEKVLGFSIRLEETLVEIRGYKDVLSQQLTVVDSTAKRAHERLDEINQASKDKMAELSQEVSKVCDKIEQLHTTLATMEANIQSARTAVAALEQNELIETKQREAIKEDPVRKFLGDNAQKILGLLLFGIAVYVLRNLGSILQSLTP